MLSRLSQVPLLRAVEQPIWVLEIIEYPPPQQAHLVNPENRYRPRTRSCRRFGVSSE